MIYAFVYYDHNNGRIYYSINEVYCFIELPSDVEENTDTENRSLLMKLVEVLHLGHHQIVSCDNMSEDDSVEILQICQEQILNSINKPKLK